VVGRYTRADDPSAIESAARRAGADAFVTQMADGYETLLGPGFEPKASLDARAEHELFESIRELFRSRAVLLISHRFSSVRSADRIYVLRRGSWKTAVRTPS
jgi:ABC-type multidrug transport system fused ATPase/permease subunit